MARFFEYLRNELLKLSKMSESIGQALYQIIQAESNFSQPQCRQESTNRRSLLGYCVLEGRDLLT